MYIKNCDYELEFRQSTLENPNQWEQKQGYHSKWTVIVEGLELDWFYTHGDALEWCVWMCHDRHNGLDYVIDEALAA